MQGSDSGRGRRPPLLARVRGNLDLVPFLVPRGSLGHLTLCLVEDRELVCGDLLALAPEPLVAEQSHVLAQLGDLGVAGFELGVAFFEFVIASEKQGTERFDRVRERLRDVHHDTYLRRCSYALQGGLVENLLVWTKTKEVDALEQPSNLSTSDDDRLLAIVWPRETIFLEPLQP